jgi:hypothetical protein
MAGFATKPLADWEVSDVCAWLRAGAGGSCGWEKKLSADYSPLFTICAVDGDTVAAMRGWGNEDWKRMGEELDAEARAAGVKPVKLGDRAKLGREIARVAALSGAREAAAAAAERERRAGEEAAAAVAASSSDSEGEEQPGGSAAEPLV